MYIGTGALQKDSLTQAVPRSWSRLPGLLSPGKCRASSHQPSAFLQPSADLGPAIARNSQNPRSRAKHHLLRCESWGPTCWANAAFWRLWLFHSVPPCCSPLTAKCSMYSLQRFELQEHQWHGAQSKQSPTKNVRWAMVTSCRAKKGQYNPYPAKQAGNELQTHQSFLKSPNSSFLPSFPSLRLTKESYLFSTFAYTNRGQGITSLLLTKCKSKECKI